MFLEPVALRGRQRRSSSGTRKKFLRVPNIKWGKPKTGLESFTDKLFR